MPNIKVGVYGSAVENKDSVLKKAAEVGTNIAKFGCTTVTGACTGIPHEASKAANLAGGKTIGFSPAVDMGSHQKIGYPSDFSEMIYIPAYYEYKDSEETSKKYRNVASVAFAEAAICIGGRIGTLNEFTIAYDLGKVIGILEGSGGMSQYIKQIIETAEKKTGEKVIFESDPRILVETVILEVQEKQGD